MFRFELFLGLRATYDVHLRHILESAYSGLPVLIELFSLGATAEALHANIDRISAISLQRDHIDLKFMV